MKTKCKEEIKQTLNQNCKNELGMVVHTCNPSIWKSEPGGSQVQGQPGLHRNTCLKKKNCKKRQRMSLSFYERINSARRCNNCKYTCSQRGTTFSEIKQISVDLKAEINPNIKIVVAGCWWLRPVIRATQEAEIRKIAVLN
jgi:hypothetical protein